MNGFSRTAKNAAYVGCKNAIFGAGVGIALALWFLLLDTGEVGAVLGRIPQQMLAYGLFLMAINGAFYTVITLPTELSMGCTRKHAAYGNALMNIILITVLMAAVAICKVVIPTAHSANLGQDMMMYFACSFAASGLGSLLAILVGKFGKVAYIIMVSVIAFGFGGFVTFASLMEGNENGGFGLNFSWIHSPLVLLGAVAFFVVGHLVLKKYISRIDVKL